MLFLTRKNQLSKRGSTNYRTFLKSNPSIYIPVRFSRLTGAAGAYRTLVEAPRLAVHQTRNISRAKLSALESYTGAKFRVIHKHGHRAHGHYCNDDVSGVHPRHVYSHEHGTHKDPETKLQYQDNQVASPNDLLNRGTNHPQGTTQQFREEPATAPTREPDDFEIAILSPRYVVQAMCLSHLKRYNPKKAAEYHKEMKSIFHNKNLTGSQKNDMMNEFSFNFMKVDYPDFVINAEFD